MIQREEENHYTSSLSYSYSYSYDSASSNQPHTTTDNHIVTENDEEYDATESTTVDIDNLDSSSSSDASIDVGEDSSDKISSLTTSDHSSSNTSDTVDTSLEAVSVESNDVGSVSLLGKSMIGLGIGCTAMLALLSSRKKRRGSLN